MKGPTLSPYLGLYTKVWLLSQFFKNDAWNIRGVEFEWEAFFFFFFLNFKNLA